MPVPFYVASDVLALFEVIPCAHIAGEKNALKLFQKMYRDGQELGTVLSHFPNVRYEPLEMHYALSKAIAVTSERLISDLTSYFGWRGVVFAAFLVAFQPRAQFAEFLHRARRCAPHNQWLFDLALREIEDKGNAKPSELQSLIRAIAASLPTYPRERVRLREWPIGETLVRFQSASAHVAATYRNDGADAAIAEMKRSPWSKFFIN